MGTYVNQIPYVLTMDGWYNRFGGYASESISAANNMASNLANMTAYVPDIGFTPPDTINPNVTTASVEDPNIPSYENTNVVSHPGNFNTDDVSHTILTAPIFDINTLSLNIPELPTIETLTVPSKPELELDQVYPDTPSTTLPTAPSLISLDLPTLEDLNIPTFLSTPPSSTDIVVPGNTFGFNEELYSDELLSKVKDELLIRLSGGTGLEPVVENAIWDRGRDREHTASLQAQRELLNNSAQAGYTRPSGAVQSALDRVVQETTNKVIELSREIMITQANLEQENIKHSIQQTIALEDILIREHSNVQNRALDVAKYVQDIALTLYNAAIAKYEIELGLYKVEAEVFKTLLEAETTKVDIFKAEIDAQLALGQINEQNVRVYSAQVDAINTVVDMYKSEVEAVSTRLRGEVTKIDAFNAEISAYSSQIQANTEVYKGYEARLGGEQAKADIYESQVKAYASRIQAYAVEQSSQDNSTKLDISVEELRLKSYLANLEAFIKSVQSDQLNYQSRVDLYKGEASMYNAKTDYNTASAEIALKNFELQLQQTQFSSSKALEAVRVNSDAAIASNNLLLEGMKASGNIHSQIASTSLNAINLSSSVSQSLNNNLSEGYSLSGQI